MIGFTWDGIHVGLIINGISMIFESSIVTLTIRTTKQKLMEEIK